MNRAVELMKLDEKFLDGFKYNSSFGEGYVEIYINPSQQELLDLVDSDPNKEIRFIADYNTKKVYAWGASSAIHATVIRKLGLKEWAMSGEVPIRIDGNAIKEQGKLYLSQSDSLSHLFRTRYDYYEDIMRRSWKWLEKYISCSDFIFDEKERIRERKEKTKKLIDKYKGVSIG